MVELGIENAEGVETGGKVGNVAVKGEEGLSLSDIYIRN